MDITNHNKKAWNNYVDLNDRWTKPVGKDEIEKAKNGEWNIILTATKAVPKNWFSELKNLKILGLASGGGQQGPILAALGADVTIYDNADKQLLQDKKVSDEFGLNIKTIQGDMQNLEGIEDNSFDLIFNPCSVVFAKDVKQVWKECFRVLKPKGILMSGLMNPISFLYEENEKTLKYHQPYSDLNSLPKSKLEELISKNEALIFGHSLNDLIGGQLEAGFLLTDMYEDDWNGESILDEYFPSYIATRAIKP